MEESGLFHVPAALFRRKMLRDPLNTKFVGPIVGTLRRVSKSLNPNWNLSTIFGRRLAATPTAQ